MASGFDHDVVAFDRHRHGFGDVRPGNQPRPRLDRDRVAARAKAARVAPGLAGANVEFPAVPRAADDLARAGIAISAGSVRFHEAGLTALMEAAAPVRAAIVERKELAAEIEDNDRASVDLHELAPPRRN